MKDSKALIDRSCELLKDVKRIDKTRMADKLSRFDLMDLASRSAHFIQSVTGPRSVYSDHMRTAMKDKILAIQFLSIAGILQAFHKDMVQGHLVNLKHEAEAVVVSEILTQARKLAGTKGVHPAASVIVACAGVEEFLRSWCDAKGISVIEKQRSIAKFAGELRAASLIDLPVERRILSWADYRNDAAHGANWANITPEISNRVLREIDDFVLDNRNILG